jgi:hypothetical protein
VIKPQRSQDFFDPDPERAVDHAEALFFVKKAPHYWLRPRPREDVTFDLEHDEALFLQARLQSLRTCLLSEAASLASRSAPSAKTVWADPLIQEAARRHGELNMLHRAQLASSMAYLIRAIYAALVEMRRNDTAATADMSLVDDPRHYRTILEDLLIGGDEVTADIASLNVDELRRDLTRSGDGLWRVVSNVKQSVSRVRRRHDIDQHILSKATMDLFEREEIRRKGVRRARLPDTSLGAARRSGFTDETINVVGIDYRWQTVSMLLRDLHRGLRQ